MGLFGGSFNPPHAGHVHAARRALLQLKLDCVWLLVTPGNPLKDRNSLPSAAARAAQLQALIGRDRRLIVTTIEAALGSRYTADTIARLGQRYPRTRFVWVMGSDGLISFTRWDRWRRIADSVPVAIIDRPPYALRALASRAAQHLRAARQPPRRSATLALCPPPAWTVVTGPRLLVASSDLRQRALIGDTNVAG